MSVPIVVSGVTYQVPSGPEDQNWAAKQILFQQALANAVNGGAYSPGTWHAHPSYGSGWSNAGGYQVPQYRVSSSFQVSLRGAAHHVGQSLTTVFTLPAGFRPPAKLSFSVGVYNGIDFEGGVVVVDVDGSVTVVAATDCNAVDLSSINFSTVT